MFQQIKQFFQSICQSPIQMPTEIIHIASELDVPYTINDVNSYINDFAIECDWLYDHVTIGPDINYILFICVGLFAVICMECIFVGPNDNGNNLDLLENENMFYYYDNRAIGRYRYLCNAETANGRRCRRRAINATRCNLH